MLSGVSPGIFPFVGSTSEEIHERMRRQKVLSPGLMGPGDSTRAFGNNRTRSHSFSRLWLIRVHNSMARWNSSALFRKISVEERERSEREEHRAKRTAAGSFGGPSSSGVSENFSHRGPIVIVAGAVGGPELLKNVMKPRIQPGWLHSRWSVCYSSINRFDSQAMQDCVVGGAGQSQINEATNLFSDFAR